MTDRGSTANTVQRKPQHNQRLKALLEQAAQDIEAARSEDQLVAVIERVKAFDGPLVYHFVWSKALMIVPCVIAGLMSLIHIAIASPSISEEFLLTIWFPCGVIALCGFMYMSGKNGRIRKLSERLYIRNLLLDNRLRELGAELPALQQRLLTDFFELRRGNHSRQLKAGYEGYYQGHTHAFTYRFYHLHYVDRRTETYTDSKGNRKTRTVDTHFDRYGIVMPFQFVSQMAILSTRVDGLKGVSYQPSSNRFNRQFKVLAGTEMIAARFLKPTIVLACEEAASRFKALNLECNAQASLCMSFGNGEWIASARQKYDFKTPDAFIAEVKEHTVLPELHAALDFIHTLMVYSDSNFQKAGE
ncbi:hypothetical protein EDF81_2813 [Enterobacter sp. BIGb0383]|uniref:hypothetical protein n=1 Tax=unclassified Enterobacter TaxID=2608935 RepID=UPI000F4A6D44|nr:MULTISPECIES: hypothetical protein [unclassified Enterobacter]ROP59989.1 hypothetical protein EDF81_2813 [Enterobacter sp. BIGb0383]ROS08542.1 hypothetical protein EC848_2022 [Enterobacter sp. BIGb0359]